MKYDFDLDLTNSNSLLLILEQIRRGSVVLEFGPANGRMTKYLKQELDCEVYLAEIDEEAGKQALLYGKDLVIGDVENFEWFERYRDIKFDYIVFADVLEHLRDPKTVLDRCKLLLKHEGSVLLSVPNLAHNSVLINLMNNEFEYTSVGLLDNTHIHFFTKNSLENMVSQAGYFPIKRMATYSKVGTNELVNTVDSVKGIPASYWNTREYGEIYQYVYEIKAFREQTVNSENYIRPTLGNYYAEAFLGKEGYTPDKSLKTEIENIEGVSRIVFKSDMLLDEFRFDPVNTSAIIKVHQMTGFDKDNNAHELCLKNANCELSGNGIMIFFTGDPIMIIKSCDEADIVRAELVVEYISIDGEAIRKVSDATIKAAMTKEFQSENEILRADIALREQNYNNIIASKDEQIRELQLKIANLEQKVSDSENEIMAMRNSNSWKMTKIFRRS